MFNCVANQFQSQKIGRSRNINTQPYKLYLIIYQQLQMMLVIFWTEHDFCINLIAGIHSIKISQTHEQPKKFFNTANTVFI